MADVADKKPNSLAVSIPLFGARKIARELAEENSGLRIERDEANSRLEKLSSMAQAIVSELKAVRQENQIFRKQIEEIGGLSVAELEMHRSQLQKEFEIFVSEIEQKKADAIRQWESVAHRVENAKRFIVESDDIILIQEAGIYQYQHPLEEAVAYREALEILKERIKAMVRTDGGAILAATDWTVNGSVVEGRKMVRDFSKLMLRAFNAEADNLVRKLKPYKLGYSIDRLSKVADTIQRLGQIMNIRITPSYLEIRIKEMELTADFLEKQAEEKEAEREERERLKEEQKVQQELEREREKLEKERQHYSNALIALSEKGDEASKMRLLEHLAEVEKAIDNVDYRTANTRAGYVYVISNIGSFGESMVKVGLTRRLDPTERIRELSDASVPFNFDIHAIFFSKDAVSIEGALHQRLAHARVNTVNRRREFFHVTPLDVREHLSELAGELLEFQEEPEALEYRQSVRQTS